MAMKAGAIRQPGDMKLPDDVWAVLEHFKTEEVWDNLSPQGERDFQTEVLEALRVSIAGNDLRPLQETLESWYRTLIVLKDPSFGPKFEWATKNPPDPKAGRSLKDFRKSLGL